MSLDITLVETKPTDVFEINITHNLIDMAKEADLYTAMWRPGELGITKAKELIPLLDKGLDTLLAVSERFQKLNPDNSWGDYWGFVRCVRRYLAACKDHPEATIRVCK